MAGRWTKGLSERGVPALIHDYLETHYGTWYTIDQIVGIIGMYRPEAQPKSIRRAVMRLTQNNHIESMAHPYLPSAHWYRVPERTYMREEEAAS
jgi:hypothetical protein